MDALRIDCDSCVMRGPACGQCVVSVLCGPPDQIDFTPDEYRAIVSLASFGMVPPLRMVPPTQANGTEG